MTFLGGPPIDVDYFVDSNWWADVARGSPTDCWPWGKSIASHGYGQTWDGLTVRLAHRVAWTLTVGVIPDDMTIDHLCRNRLCCNVRHMRLLTNAENAGGNGNAVKTRCKRGHSFDAANTYHDSKGHRRCRTCQRAYRDG